MEQLLESSKYDFQKAYLRLHFMCHTDEKLRKWQDQIKNGSMSATVSVDVQMWRLLNVNTFTKCVDVGHSQCGFADAKAVRSEALQPLNPLVSGPWRNPDYWSTEPKRPMTGTCTVTCTCPSKYRPQSDKFRSSSSSPWKGMLLKQGWEDGPAQAVKPLIPANSFHRDTQCVRSELHITWDAWRQSSLV